MLEQIPAATSGRPRRRRGRRGRRTTLACAATRRSSPTPSTRCDPVGVARPVFLLLAALGGLTGGCIDEVDRLELATLTMPLDAFCAAQVVGIGAVDTETDYLPHVVACENGGADFEALKAQAVAARSVLYYKMATAGSIRDGQSDQVYTCNRPPGDEHRNAVNETAGLVATYRNTIVFAFYVAGAIPSAADCVAVPGDRDSYNTERYVTYNWGRSGDDIEQTTLGWVNRGNHANRGCQSQNGAHCLAETGWGYRDILSFYYGTDLQLVRAEGACVQDQGCQPEVAGQETIIDDGDGCFSRGSCDSWREEGRGHSGHLWWTHAWDGAPDCTARWRLSFAEAGDYQVEAWVEDFGNRSRRVPYTIRHAGQESEVVVSQAGAAGWLELGTFRFAAGGDQWVRLSDATGEPYADRLQVLADALRLRRPGGRPGCTDDGECSDGDACNGVESCRDGSCAAGQPLTCQDDEACTEDRCDPAAGCVFPPLADGTPCPAGSCRGGACRPGEGEGEGEGEG
ncbi:MAG: hypothetical protein FJ125_15195, partial [Deltaproteobacteria bacterium]|nr:hypothetical protein [Deltaproteobacteria bacterium]